MNRTFTRIWRFTLLVTVPIAIFWLVFYFWQGYVPAQSTIGFVTNDPAIFLSFGISRWFDILIGPLWVVTLIIWSSHLDNTNTDEPGIFEIFQYIAWIVTLVCAVDAIGAGIATGLVTNVVAVLAIGLAIVIIYLIKFLVRWAMAN
jgi:hypothetical protein